MCVYYQFLRCCLISLFLFSILTQSEYIQNSIFLFNINTSITKNKKNIQFTAIVTRPTYFLFLQPRKELNKNKMYKILQCLFMEHCSIIQSWSTCRKHYPFRDTKIYRYIKRQPNVTDLANIFIRIFSEIPVIKSRII